MKKHRIIDTIGLIWNLSVLFIITFILGFVIWWSYTSLIGEF